MTLEFNRPQTPAETKLREWVEAQPQAVSFARVHGALHGIIASAQAQAEFDRSALRLLRVEAPDEIHALAVQAVKELDALLGVDEGEPDHTVTLPRLTEQEDFLEWMAGLGAVAISDPEPFQRILATRMDLAQQGRDQRGRIREEGRQEVEDVTRKVIFVMVMTPEEYLPAEFSPEARAKFAEIRAGYLAEDGWDTEAYEHALLDSLNGVHTAWAVRQMMNQPELQQLLQSGVWDDDEPLTPIRREGRKIRPNEACPCGSGKKYKKCHGAPGAPALPEI